MLRKMIQAQLSRLSGKEVGQFLALDLGGTNFRVILLEMENGKIKNEKVTYYSVPEEKRLGEGEKLFDFLAECILDFTTTHDLSSAQLPLGFTFSFPMTQNALDVGVLVTWTKSFNCPDVVGKDAVKMLNEAIHRLGSLKVDVVAVLNDTTGTLVKGAYDDPETCIGLILGTGCNGAYIEKVENVCRWEGEKYDAKEVIIDPEFGAFGDNGCIDFCKTEFDRQIDAMSLLPGSFTFEKYFAGKYVGDLCRFVLLKLCSEGLLFNGTLCEKLSGAGSLTAANVSHIESDSIGGSTKETEEILKALQQDFTKDDVEIVKFICALIGERSALLVAVPIAFLINRMKREMSSVAVTGSLYEYHPRLKSLLEKYITKYAPERKFKTFNSSDGSGKGAGLVAAIATRMKQEHKN